MPGIRTLADRISIPSLQRTTLVLFVETSDTLAEFSRLTKDTNGRKMVSLTTNLLMEVETGIFPVDLIKY